MKSAILFAILYSTQLMAGTPVLPKKIVCTDNLEQSRNFSFTLSKTAKKTIEQNLKNPTSVPLALRPFRMPLRSELEHKNIYLLMGYLNFKFSGCDSSAYLNFKLQDLYSESKAIKIVKAAFEYEFRMELENSIQTCKLYYK